MKIFAFLLFTAPAVAGGFPLTKVAAGSTIAVNALTIRSTLAEGRKVVKATKKTVVKVAKKVVGK